MTGEDGRETAQRRALEADRDKDFVREIRAWMKDRTRALEREARDHSRFRKKGEP